MAAPVFSTTIASALKETLEEIITDESYEKSDLVMKRIFNQKNMKDAYEDDLEIGGPGLASETAEGADISLGTIQEGVLTRYIARKFALGLIVTEEAVEDNKYDRVIQAGMRLKTSMWKTVEFDAANVFVRAENASYLGGDGVSLASASHTLPHGGTFSNTMGTPMSPSRAAVIVATTAVRKLPGHHGLTEGYEPKKIHCPVDQWATWSVITKSVNAPEAGEYNAINVVNRDLNLEVVANRYWDNTTTNWCIITDCDNGLNWRWRRKPRSNSWVENSNEVMHYSVSARWARGWSDPRCVYFVGA